MTLSRDELLVLLVEEAGEVVQATTKIQRFGYDVDHNVGYGNNRDQLAKECGELFAVVNALDLPRDKFWDGFRGKLARAEAARDRYGTKPEK